MKRERTVTQGDIENRSDRDLETLQGVIDATNGRPSFEEEGDTRESQGVPVVESVAGSTYLKYFLASTGKILGLDFVFVASRQETSRIDIEVLWRGKPGLKSREAAENLVISNLSPSRPFADRSRITVRHVVSDKGGRSRAVRPETSALEKRVTDSRSPGGEWAIGLGYPRKGAAASLPPEHLDSLLDALADGIRLPVGIRPSLDVRPNRPGRDPVTNLYDKQLFWDLLDHEIALAKKRKTEVALLLVDVDDLKAFNRVHGTAAGDLYLFRYACFLESLIRPEEIAFGYGGGKYAVIVPDATEEEMFLLAERIRSKTESFSAALPDGRLAGNSVSIGAALSPRNGQGSQELYLAADTSLVRAKIRGKNQIGFPDEDGILILKNETEQKADLIVNAIHESWVVPFYQPIVDLVSGEIFGHEVFMRIHLPDGSFMTPAEFLQVAKSEGLIGQMDIIMMRKVLNDLCQNRYDRTICFNTSPGALSVGSFKSDTKKLLKDLNVDPSSVILDILGIDNELGEDILEQFVGSFREIGCRFSIDDFGTGRSFSFIKKYPIDFIKIDSEFIRGLGEKNPKDEAIVMGILKVSGAMGIRAIAKSVENETMLGAVRNAGIPLAQGYFFGSPARSRETSPFKLPGPKRT
ncbi:MAG: EAL domain-containing protein [Sulfobacillus sp.]